MIAYNNQWLENLYVVRVAGEAFRAHLIDETAYLLIRDSHPSRFYKPNVFIRIGLFVLTIIILLFSYGLFSLFFIDSPDNGFALLAIFLGGITYGGLEWLIKNKNHYRSGVDDAMLWMAAICIGAGISVLFKLGETTTWALAFVISLMASLRFTDRLMFLVCFFSVLGFCFSAWTSVFPTWRLFVPFILMTIAVTGYLSAISLEKQLSRRLYTEGLTMMKIAALFAFYLAGNYFVVREIGNGLVGLALPANARLPLGWVFWLITIITPFIYLARGLQKKDRILIRVGLAVFLLAALTYQYYFIKSPVEGIMTIAGLVVVLVAYGLIKYLEQSKFGFGYGEPTTPKPYEQLESLVVAETFSPVPPGGEHPKFGGGSFGGAGSSGEF